MGGNDPIDPYTASKAWVSDDDLEALKMDRTMFHTDESPAAMARRILHEGSPGAAASLVKLSLHAESESVRLSASKAVLDYAFKEGSTEDGKEPWEKLYGAVVQEFEGMLKDAADEAAARANKGRSAEEAGESEGPDEAPFGKVVD